MLSIDKKFTNLALVATITGILPIIILALFKHTHVFPSATVSVYCSMILIYITGVHWGFSYQQRSLSHLLFSLIGSLLPMLVLLLQTIVLWTQAVSILLLLAILLLLLALEHLLPLTKTMTDFLNIRRIASCCLAAAIIFYLIIP